MRTWGIFYCKLVLLKCERSSLKQRPRVPCKTRFLKCCLFSISHSAVDASFTVLQMYRLKKAGYSLDVAGQLNGNWQAQESE